MTALARWRGLRVPIILAGFAAGLVVRQATANGSTTIYACKGDRSGTIRLG